MQLLLIFGIVFAIAAVLFALQNNALVTVTIALWHFESTLAVVLLLAIGLGVLITGLVSTPTVLRGQWSGARLRRQVAALEKEKAALEQRVAALEAEAARKQPPQLPASAEPQRFAELKSILTGEDQAPKPPTA
ncbi:MAG: lipopolysaccharide assembly protein LapA domain-containing protein [Burkholderiales bacterium]|nr:Lipopolysaccharide assembly protein A [Rhodocyclaceae bacterium]MCZ2419724.1 lipopolysaccharide assembly protein LapA domain-containing protein [Burkholderiales bacterium]